MIIFNKAYIYIIHYLYKKISMNTTWISKDKIDRKWFLVDATELVLGRLAAYLALRLRGKHKSIYSPNLDCGDYFVVVNSDKISMTGNKLEQKFYHKHTGFPGGLKSKSYRDILNSKQPDRLLRLSVKRMLPKGVLGREQIKKLFIYAGEEHPHGAQKPEIIKFESLNKKNKRGQKFAK